MLVLPSHLKTIKNEIGKVTTNCYDAAGRTVSVMDAKGNVQPFSYDNGSLTNQQTSGAYVTYTMDAVSNITVKSHQGASPMTFTYDAAGYLTTFTTPLGCVTKYGYSSAGAGLGTSMVHTIVDPRGYATMYIYDAYKRVVSMASSSAVWTYTYNSGQFGEATAGLRKDYLANAPDSVRIASKMGSQYF